MRIAELAQSIDPDMVERLPLSVAHRLAARNAPTDVVSEVIAEVKSGEMPTAADVKERIENAHGKSTQKRAVSNVDCMAEVLVDVLDSAKLDELADQIYTLSNNSSKNLYNKDIAKLHTNGLRKILAEDMNVQDDWYENILNLRDKGGFREIGR